MSSADCFPSSFLKCTTPLSSVGWCFRSGVCDVEHNWSGGCPWLGLDGKRDAVSLSPLGVVLAANPIKLR